ncbi:hypothetical protein [Streptomyces sp. NPDC088131]
MAIPFEGAEERSGRTASIFRARADRRFFARALRAAFDGLDVTD